MSLCKGRKGVGIWMILNLYVRDDSYKGYKEPIEENEYKMLIKKDIIK